MTNRPVAGRQNAVGFAARRAARWTRHRSAVLRAEKAKKPVAAAEIPVPSTPRSTLVAVRRRLVASERRNTIVLLWQNSPAPPHISTVVAGRPTERKNTTHSLGGPIWGSIRATNTVYRTQIPSPVWEQLLTKGSYRTFYSSTKWACRRIGRRGQWRSQSECPPCTSRPLSHLVPVPCRSRLQLPESVLRVIFRFGPPVRRSFSRYLLHSYIWRFENYTSFY